MAKRRQARSGFDTCDSSGPCCLHEKPCVRARLTDETLEPVSWHCAGGLPHTVDFADAKTGAHYRDHRSRWLLPDRTPLGEGLRGAWGGTPFVDHEPGPYRSSSARPSGRKGPLETVPSLRGPDGFRRPESADQIDSTRRGLQPGCTKSRAHILRPA